MWVCRMPGASASLIPPTSPPNRPLRPESPHSKSPNLTRNHPDPTSVGTNQVRSAYLARDIVRKTSMRFASALRPTWAASAAYRAFVAIWLVCSLILCVSDPKSALLGLGGLVFAALLTWFTLRLVKPPPPGTEDVLRASGSKAQLRLQTVIVGLTCAWVLVEGWAYGSLLPGGRHMHIPHLSHVVWRLYTTRIPHLHDTLGSYLLFTTFLLAAILLGLCGRTRRSLGLVKPATSVTRATLACIALAVLFACIGLVRGKITFAGLGFLLLHNLFSNGFTEEFFARGIVFSQLRARLTDDWALVVQALIFAAGHFGSTLPETAVHGNYLLALANNIALNAPMGFALGVMALRGRSLLQGTIVHMFLDTMTKTM